MKIVKFGGSVFKDENSFNSILKLLDDSKTVIIVSAPFGITDRLKENAISSEFLLMMYRRFKQLLGFDSSVLKQRVFEIECEKNFEKILSHGERCNSLALKLFLEKKGFDVEEILPENINFSLTEYGEFNLDQKISKFFEEEKTYIVPGFYGVFNGQIKTIGRGGSDYTATAIAYLLDSKEVILYKDVSSVFSCDPKIVKNSVPITKISYEVAELLSYFGAKVINYKAIKPAKLKDINVKIKSVDSESFTLISKEMDLNVFSISYLESLILIKGYIKEIPVNAKYMDVFHRKAWIVATEEQAKEIEQCFYNPVLIGNLSLVFVTGNINIEKKLLILNTLYSNKCDFFVLKDDEKFIILLVKRKNVKDAVNIIHNILFAKEAVV
ncbi:aspartate kinase [Thermosipho ferrireducens]|uniref:Aspartate kinase n=1 Tax=Thermosipho ferrireducens TaxID=2571116 RepID=A0ABX7S8U2_9BACT|nr:aspartate kinase [Thermosipho ferrireducens]